MTGDRDDPTDLAFSEVDRPSNERLSVGVAASIKQLIRTGRLQPG